MPSADWEVSARPRPPLSTPIATVRSISTSSGSGLIPRWHSRQVLSRSPNCSICQKRTQHNPAETVQAVKHWLEHSGKWLLIFDNADEPELLKAYYPRTPRGHILLTSRAQLFDTLGIARPLALEKMDPEEALDFLFKRTARAQSDPAEKNAAEQLAAELGYLPLALEQAAAYIVAKTARFQDYLASYQRQRLALLNKAQPKTGEYPASVAKHLGAQLPGSRKRPGRS